MDKEDIVRAVQKMEDYIELHIHDKISLFDLAQEAGYSPWYAGKIFKEYTGKTPFDFIRARRLTAAAMALRDGKDKIIDVALDFVFDSQEGFTRAFSKEFGLPPRRYRSNTPPIQLFMPFSAVDSYHILNRKGEISMKEEMKTTAIFVQIMERPARKVLIKRGIKASGYFDYCNEVGCDVWAMLSSVKEALYEPVGMWLPKHLIKEGTSQYVQGVELPSDYNNEVPEGFELIDLPECKVMVFQGEPYEDENFQEAIKEVWRHVKKFNPETYGYKWAPEEAPRFQLAPMGYRGYIEGRPVKKL